MKRLRPTAIYATTGLIVFQFIVYLSRNERGTYSPIISDIYPLCDRYSIRNGKWQNTTNKSTQTSYQWTPVELCWYQKEFSAELFCRLTSNMVIMFIGDSINFEMYQSLVHLLGKQVDKELHVMSVKERKGRTPMVINVCGSSNVTLVYRWSKQLTAGGTSIAIEQMLQEQFPTMIVLNTGAHYQRDDLFQRNVDKALKLMKGWQESCRNLNLTCPFFWQTSVPGIANCTTFSQPVNDLFQMEMHVALNPVYHWDQFKKQNDLAIKVLEESQLSYQIIDAYEVGLQRPELHVSEEDCLHNYDLAVADALNVMLLHYLHATRNVDDVLRIINHTYNFNRTTNVQADGKNFID